MATTPLFNASLAVLRQRLRLTGVPAGGDAAELILEGLMRARLTFYRRLGTTRVATLLAINYSDVPDDTNEILRALANTVEIKLVFVFLLDTMPSMFMDGSGKVQEIWNEEAPFRQGQPPEAMKVRLHEEINADMAVLSGDVELGEETNWSITNNEPDDEPPVPGATAYDNSGSIFAAEPAEEGD